MSWNAGILPRWKSLLTVWLIEGLCCSGIALLGPTNITAQAGNGNFTLNWPAGYTGLQLQTQSNDLNGANWVNVAGSTETNSWTIPMNDGVPGLFFRLVYPPQHF